MEKPSLRVEPFPVGLLSELHKDGPLATRSESTVRPTHRKIGELEDTCAYDGMQHRSVLAFRKQFHWRLHFVIFLAPAHTPTLDGLQVEPPVASQLKAGKFALLE